MASFADGKLVVPGHDGSSVTIPENEILFIAENKAAHGEARPGYRVFGLCETTPAADTGDADAPAPLASYALSSAVLREEDVHKLPPAVVRKHLVTATPLVLPSASSPLHVVVSTGSGLRQAQAFYDGVLAPLLRDAFGLTADSADEDTRYALVVTDSKSSVASFARRLCTPAAAAAPHSTPTVLLLSGDGGVVDLLNGVDGAAATPTMAILPLGTGNALFHSLHRRAYAADAAASPLVHGLRTLVRGRAAPLPSFEATFAPGASTVDASSSAQQHGGGTSIARLRGAIVASYGFHAQLVWESDTPAYRKHGDARFGIVAGELIKASHTYAADVSVVATATGSDAHSIGHTFTYVVATLVSDLQQGFTISPASQPLDGQLRLVHFGAVGGSRTMDIMKLAYNKGAHVQEADVGYEAIDAVEIRIREEDPRWRKVCIDGTIVEIPKGGWIKVRKAAAPVLNVIATI